MEMEELIEKIKSDTGNTTDMIFRKMIIDQKPLYLVYNEVLTSSDDINNFILKNIAQVIDEKVNITTNLYDFFYNSLPGHNIAKVKDYPDLLNRIFNSYTIIITSPTEIFAIETKARLDRGISEASSEQTLLGPKDAFTENFNINLGLVRKRIKSSKLWFDTFLIGQQTKTKVGLCYMKNIVEEKTIKDVKKKLKDISIDGIIDSGYIKESLTSRGQQFFPTIMATERPDLASMALLEGKIIIIVDNSPYILILPCFFVDFFHTADDYYQKPINITFIRIIRLLAFLIAIFVPAYYIAVTTHNHDALSLDLVVNFTAQRETVPFPALVEVLLMSITFEILRESDARMPSTMGTAVSILGGLVLGDAAVSAGIVSPIMIIVVAISAISGLLFSSIEMISAIRWWRFFFLGFATIFGIYGIFLGTIFLIIQLSSIKSFGKPYLAPFAPFLKGQQKDALIKSENTGIKKRNPYLASKNIIRGRQS